MRRPRDKKDFAEFEFVRSCKKSELLIEENVLNEKGDLKVALIFPNSYEIAASNLGFHLVWKLFNKLPRVRCERFFYDETFERFYSLDCQTPLDEFQIWAFCVHFENDIINVIDILKRKSVPLINVERRSFDPLIIFGGILTYADLDFLKVIPDVVLHGDFEAMVEDLAQILSPASRDELLERFSKLDFSSVKVFEKKAKEVAKFLDLSKSAPISPVVPARGEFAGRVLVEVERGCVWNCSFCMMSSCKKPARFVDPNVITKLMEKDLKLGLIASNVTDYPWLEDIVQKAREKNIWISVSSLRLDRLNENLLSYLKQHQHSFTIAPESATFKIRQILGKPFTDSQIEKALQLGRKSGFSQVKLYFMYGLDEETEEDLTAIGKMVSKAYEIGYNDVRLTLNAFVPKKGTKLGTRKMQDAKILKEKAKAIKGSIPSRCDVTFESLKQLQLQYIINQAPEGTWLEVLAKIQHTSNWSKQLFSNILLSFFSLIEERNDGFQVLTS
ncbi:B12-binding domain-containing radical SAM protein [Pseudothermotoga thermarum]|uniref:Radical SAM domain protein n=1 Tax=Pseudothermotoga thermarum DSM 5069 TaxID=688269 RepID=F7YWL0_9THEM|nr:radical SAM protein [Pseudothermotoga thermarum]AEH51991.1 Radical SAM domain protein [Pseudothermotoga thermarum DSM 5069]